MALEINEICLYLKDVLNFRNFIELPDDESNYFCISNEELKSGQISPDDRKNYLQKWMPEKVKANPDLQNDEVEVLMIPKLVCDIIPKYSRGISMNKERIWEYRKVSLLYIKAKCNIRTMKITPVQEESLVWADPIIKNRHPNPLIRFISNLFEKLFNKNSANSIRIELKQASGLSENVSDWHSYISLIENNFKKRTGKEFFTADFLVDEEGREHALYDEDLRGKTIVMKDDTVFATSHIVNLLTHIGHSAHVRLPLLESMLLDRCRKKTTVSQTLGKRINQHLGQMKNGYPLANAQRDAVHCFSELKDGEVLAVSGPPGTGKTTMLQSIVADMLVRTTLEGISNPGSASSPLILATSANNKAITNIIDAFSSSDESVNDNVSIYRRWLCYESDGDEKFVPMAAYYPSFSVDPQKKKDYFLST